MRTTLSSALTSSKAFKLSTKVLAAGVTTGSVLISQNGYTAPQPLGGSQIAEERQVSPGSKKSLALNESGVAAAKNKRYEEAKALFKKAVDSDPYNLSAVFNLAGMYVTLKNEKKALALLNSYLEKGVEDAGLHSRIADTYFSTQQVKKAIQHYKATLTLEPSYPGIYLKLGTAYSLSRQLELAEKAMAKAVAEDASNVRALGNYASILVANKKPTEAIAICKQALQVHSAAELYITLGSAYEMLPEKENALIAYKSARDVGFYSKELAAKISELEAG